MRFTKYWQARRLEKYVEVELGTTLEAAFV